MEALLKVLIHWTLLNLVLFGPKMHRNGMKHSVIRMPLDFIKSRIVGGVLVNLVHASGIL